ncbi:unnamed protein product [Phytophthora fragariaefolia]|uniref:Unnamed protein product n=1 Tax=Phytophthora fragariaefolia TaxID=1490495 RepID=A0A9W6XZN3_9STRA|nr:unnamed protein product [Phytophthora fragariaefolia]
MSDSTQLVDQFLLQSSLKPDTSVRVSRGKSVAVVNDGQSGSYSSGIVSFDCASALNGSQGYASLKDAYIVLPYVVSLKNSGSTTLNSAGRYALGMKCNIASVIDEVKVYLNGKSVITPSEFKQVWHNVRAMAELTTAEVEKHGADMFLYPDDWESIKHKTVANTYGDGYSNSGLSGNSSLFLTSGEPTRPNSGFVRRVLNNPPEVASTTTNSYDWPSLNKTTSQAIAQMRGTGAFKTGASGNAESTLGEWFTCSRFVWSIYARFSMRSISLTSTTLVAGSICPVLLGSAGYSGANLSDGMYDVIGTTATAGALRAPGGPIHNSITTIATSGNNFPFTQSRLNLPFYDIANPTWIVSKPMKTIKYLDCYSQMFEDQAGIGAITSNKNFFIPVASSHKNVKYACVIPFANTKTENYATAITTPQYVSPFDSAPWTFQPGSSIRDYQVQVGNKNVFQDVHSYDWMTFLDEFSKLSAVNGDLYREISNGLIGMDKWQTAQRILVADCSRISEADVPQSIKISGTNIATQGTNLLVLVVYERSLELDRTTGEIYKANQASLVDLNLFLKKHHYN